MSKKLIIALFSGILLAGCSSEIDVEDLENKKADEIFNLGASHMKQQNYSGAVKVFETLEKLHPYSKYIEQSRLYEGECNYKMKKYDEATSAFEIFIKTHPTHEKVPYALYMLGIIHEEQMPIVERDQEVTISALSYFHELLKRYPNNEYSKKCISNVKSLRQQLAGREVYIARFYQSRNNFAAAVGRLNTVLDLYKETIHVPEALHRLTECYIAMGLFKEAKKTNQILQKSFKSSEWAKYSASLVAKYVRN